MRQPPKTVSALFSRSPHFNYDTGTVNPASWRGFDTPDGRDAVVMGPGGMAIAPEKCGIISVDAGRLGNYIYTYITTHLFGRRYQLQPCISEVTTTPNRRL